MPDAPSPPFFPDPNCSPILWSACVMDNDPKEIELKLRVDPADIAALRNHSSFANTLRDPLKEALVSVYFDSDDMFMRDHGLTFAGAALRRPADPDHQGDQPRVGHF